MSVDGYIDDASPDRLILSSDEDLDRVDDVRARCDAILVGAGTIRRDDPRLVIRSPERQAGRLARGAAEDPVKVTITATGNLDPAARFFTTGSAARLVYCARPALAAARARLSGVAEVIDAGDSPSPVLVLCDLAERGVASVLLEGGGQLAAEFLAADLADELHLVIAPFFVGDPAAPRFAIPGGYPHGPANRMRLAEVRQLGEAVLLRYLLGTREDPRPPAEHAGEPSRAPEPAGLPAAEASGPAGEPEPGGHLAAETSRPAPAPAPEPAAPAGVHLPQPSRSPEAPSPHSSDIRWLRETIERLSVDESVMPPHPSEQYRAERPLGDRSRIAHSGGEPYGEPSSRQRSRSELHGEPSGAGQARSAPSRGESYEERSRSELHGEPSGAGQARGVPSRGESYGERSRGELHGEPPGAGQARSAPSRGSSDADLYWLRETIALSRRCRPSQTAFSVGALIVGADGTPLASGYSREGDPRDHAEEAALNKLRPGDPRLEEATLYSSLEPCGVRASRPRPCADLIIAARIPRVVYAWREPPLLATGGGADMLRAAGVSVTEVPELAAEARQVNAHLIRTSGPPSH
jgi:5-amino-6-(5-phosphoribosylamino)uracil reductase